MDRNDFISILSKNQWFRVNGDIKSINSLKHWLRNTNCSVQKNLDNINYILAGYIGSPNFNTDEYYFYFNFYMEQYKIVERNKKNQPEFRDFNELHKLLIKDHVTDNLVTKRKLAEQMTQSDIQAKRRQEAQMVLDQVNYDKVQKLINNITVDLAELKQIVGTWKRDIS